MVRSIVLSSALALTVGLSAMSGGAQAQQAPCGGNFDRWLKQVRGEAGQMGISRRVISSALRGLTPDPKVLSRDRRQGVFSQTFLKFSGRMISKNRMNRGRQLMKRHRSTFKRVRKEFGVPSSVLTAFWGLETDFGGFMGDFKTMRSLVTLAHDCRRPELFRPQVFDAMRLLERGDLSLSQMVGAWAGELGQTQFLPSDYLEIAVDYDRNGRVDLIRSVPDVLGSTGKLVRNFGWRAGEPWIQEVRVPRSMPWDQADIAITHSRAQWAKWGVKRSDGGRLRADKLRASLLLPMGKNGPAFLAYHNFTKVYLEWNKSLIYATTAAYFATRLAGAPPVRKGNGTVTPISAAQMKQLQRALARRGFDVGKIDGVLGAGTRAGVKAMQIKFGLPADSYPTAALLRKLR
ncbi:MAG: lytic murein transglycosylase [Alphaproteobacteria bacterium]|nr:lytic murein transglycosylase [Alphaproteobacteria bacterium]